MRLEGIDDLMIHKSHPCLKCWRFLWQWTGVDFVCGSLSEICFVAEDFGCDSTSGFYHPPQTVALDRGAGRAVCYATAAVAAEAHSGQLDEVAEFYRNQRDHHHPGDFLHPASTSWIRCAH